MMHMPLNVICAPLTVAFELNHKLYHEIIFRLHPIGMPAFVESQPLVEFLPLVEFWLLQC